MKIAALGRTKILWNTIQTLCTSGHEVALIATCKSAPEYEIREHDFERLASDVGASFLCTQNLNRPAVIDQMRQLGIEVAVSVNWINLIGPEVCSAFDHGILNAHAGDLPRYRGNAPVAWAILQGEQQIGITIHQMDPYEIDAGPILLKDYYPLSEHTYIGEVLGFLSERIPQLFLRAVNGLTTGTLVATPQPRDPNLALRCYPRCPEDGLIDWHQPAESLARLVRASSEPFAGAFTYFQGKRLTVWRAHSQPWPYPYLAVPGHVVQRWSTSGEVAVATRYHMLVLEEVELGDQGRCLPVTILKSLRNRLGAHQI